MPCVGFSCPGNPYLWRTIEDCEKCEERCLAIETLRYIWQWSFVKDADHYHNDPKVISVTETFGCLRQSYFNRKDDYTEEPRRFLARVNGTVLHWAREQANQDGCSEVVLSCDLGDGWSLKGTADRLTDDYIMDYKTMDRPRKTYDEDNAKQMSVYDEMAGGPERELLVCQCGRTDEAIHAVHRVESALDTAVGRANLLIGALCEEDPAILAPEGREIKIWRITMCDRCPHVDACEAADEMVAEG